MPKHNVTIKAPELTLGKSDFEFWVYQDGSLFGKLLVSHGAPAWKSPRGRAKKMSWADLAEAFSKPGARRTASSTRTAAKK